MSAHGQRVRCAIYTRKSSEEGLEQAFNSLDAQREACAAYILSQASEGWTNIGEVYDDGGLSGGTLERPALQRLLADVAAKRIDIIVVYKVDRLTRSLLDFAKLVEAFDAAGTSFVSVTQSFNTTTSMGRLTLNMLLSFAQFEREVTAERIRDKIAASKAKGMWMGGVPPLGYKPDGRSLAIIEEHAAVTRHIFERYLALGSVRLLADELVRTRVLSPERSTTTGKRIGGCHFSRGQLYLMLKCVTYTGQIGHHGKLYPGKHPAIIDPDTFARVQAMLADHTRGARTRGGRASTSLLAGKIVDGDGKPLIAAHATRTVAAHGGEGKARYRYYVSRDLHHGTVTTGMRIPAREIERLVVERVGELLRDPLQLAAAAHLDLSPGAFAQLHARCEDFASNLAKAKLAATIVCKVQITDDQVVLTCSTQAIAGLLSAKRQDGASEELILTLDARLTRSGRMLRLVHAGIPASEDVSQSLVRLLTQAHRWWAELRKGEIEIKALAQREGLTGSYLTRVLRLAFLSPALTQAILTGRQAAGMDVRALTLDSKLDASWAAQALQYCSA